MKTRQAGVTLIVVSAFVFSSAGIFTKGLSAPAWDIIFWRGIAAAGFTLVYLALRGALMREVRAFGLHALLVTLMMEAGTAAFIPAFKLTAVANVALIYGAAPLIAAALAWAFLREAPGNTVSMASLAAFGGVLLIVSGSLGAIALRGDLLALLMTVLMAGTMVFYRAYPHITAALPAALSSVVLLPVAWFLGDPLAVSPVELPVMVLFGLVFAVASVTLIEGARRLPPAETALLSTLEMPLAPVLALVLLAERPAGETIIGGVIILGAVMWSQTSGRPVKVRKI